MCTAATYKTKDFYMGRTLDYEFSYGEQITITPRNYEFDFRFAGKIKSHYALIGMAFVAGGYPLYYDAVNEKGLGMAGLNFVKATFTNLDWLERSPGIPIPPIPLLYASSCNTPAKVLSGCFLDTPA